MLLGQLRNRIMNSRKHIPILDHLRGAAALSVCLYHFSASSHANSFLSDTDPLRQFASVGWLGVQAFFVISGFVIPYSLHHRSYSLTDGGNFLSRRLKRLEPPYFACILLVLCIQFCVSFVPGYRGDPESLTVAQLLSHVAYLNAVLGYPWINPVFWTLAIEFQYYIFTALIFPFLNNHQKSTRMLTLLGVAFAGILGFGNEALLPHWLPLFALGMAAYFGVVGHVTHLEFAMLVPALGLVAGLVTGLQEALVGVLTCISIYALAQKEIHSALTPLAWLGVLSYSVYLIHMPIGIRVINIAARFTESTALRYLTILVALAISIGTAYVFYRLVEVPSQKWAKLGAKSAAPSEGKRVHSAAHRASNATRLSGYQNRSSLRRRATQESSTEGE